MNIGIVTIAYNGYGKFVDQWLSSIKKLTIKPQAITIILGRNHDSPNINEILNKYSSLPIKFKLSNYASMGILRNLAVSRTNTKWIMYLSVDDIILPHAIEEFKKYEKDSDWICIQWLTRGLDNPEGSHRGVIPYENYMNRKAGRRGGFIIAQSPYRRWIWEANHYEEHDYPNAPFIAKAVESGARFAMTERPCTVYLRRSNSHARITLIQPEQKKQAVYKKREMERKIDAYYAAL